METSLGLFLLRAAVISLTGVMLPGPLTAATIAKGYSDKHAGAWIAAGHAVIEIPLIAAIYFGLGHFISSPSGKGYISCRWLDAALPGFPNVSSYW